MDRSPIVAALLIAVGGLTEPWLTASVGLAQADGTAAAAGVEPHPADVERGRAAFEVGREAYEEGDFAEALERFRSAYELTRAPALLFNLGAAADRLRRDQEALGYYRAYLEAVPDADNRQEVEGRIYQIEQAVAERDREARRVEEAMARLRQEAVERREPRGPPIGAWFTLSAGATVAATGAVLLGVGFRNVRRVEDAPAGTPWTDVEASHARAPRLTGAGIAMLGLGIASAAAGLSWALVPSRNDDTASAVHIDVGPTGVAIGGWF